MTSEQLARWKRIEDGVMLAANNPLLPAAARVAIVEMAKELRWLRGAVDQLLLNGGK